MSDSETNSNIHYIDSQAFLDDTDIDEDLTLQSVQSDEKEASQPIQKDETDLDIQRRKKAIQNIQKIVTRIKTNSPKLTNIVQDLKQVNSKLDDINLSYKKKKKQKGKQKLYQSPNNFEAPELNSTSFSTFNSQSAFVLEGGISDNLKPLTDFNTKRIAERQHSIEKKKFKGDSEIKLDHLFENEHSGVSETNIIWKTDIFRYIYDIRQAVHILRPWIPSVRNPRKFDKIPENIIEQVIRENQQTCKSILNSSKLEQLEFLQAVFEHSVEYSRKQFMDEILDIWMKNHLCFKKVAKCFNQSYSNILEEVSEFNMPDIDMLVKELSLPKPVIGCVNAGDVEKIRKAALKTSQTLKHQGCDCCVKSYISNELQKHEDKLYKFTFDEVYKSDQLWKSDINIPNGGVFISDTKFYDSETEKRTLVETISNLGITSDMIREIEEEKEEKSKPKKNKSKKQN